MAIAIKNESDNLIFMKEVTVTEFARNLSRYFDEVEAGETIQLFRGKKLIARLLPPAEEEPNGTRIARRIANQGGNYDPIWDKIAVIVDDLKTQELEWAENNPIEDPWKKY
jgi:antitoxin (DNA-binding transcriptional repressor) of toxin-antitoxin stability system